MNQTSTSDVLRLYQAIVGRPPEAEVSQLYADLLETGASTEQVEQLMRRSPDARARREGLAALPHHGVVPYTLDEAPEGQVLLVQAPRRSWGFEPPEPPAADAVPERTHLLGLGVDNERSDLAPSWRLDATELIGGKAARLGVPLSRTVCFGIGEQGALAMSVGLTAGVGWIVAGGSDMTQNDDGNLNALVAHSTQTTVHLYVSTTDRCYAAAFALQQAARAAGGSCDIVEGDYSTEAELRLGARRHVRRVLEHLTRRG